MTLNDMLETGIVLQGSIEVKRYDNMKDEYVTVFNELCVDGLMGHVDESWADCEVGYMYSPYGMNGMTIEVADGEWTQEHEEVWACADCADFYEPEAGPILDYADGWWTCPKCGCNTCAPEEDLCYRVDGKTAYIG